MMEFHERLKKLMEDKGISMRALAATVVYCSDSTVGCWCSGKTEPRMGDLVRMAKYFGVTLDYLVLGK